MQNVDMRESHNVSWFEKSKPNADLVDSLHSAGDRGREQDRLWMDGKGHHFFRPTHPSSSYIFSTTVCIAPCTNSFQALDTLNSFSGIARRTATSLAWAATHQDHVTLKLLLSRPRLRRRLLLS